MTTETLDLDALREQQRRVGSGLTTAEDNDDLIHNGVPALIEQVERLRAALVAIHVEAEEHVAYDVGARETLDILSPFDEGMCPNCQTPWKCNGPHLIA